MIIVNLYGSPGAGKSTGAAYVFSLLKMAGVNAELVTEYAKDLAWENNTTATDNQAYIFGQQYYKTTRCEDKVDVIVTDSPIMLSALYNDSELLGDAFNDVVARVAKSYDTLNYFIIRNKPFNPAGRFHTEEESDSLVEPLKKLLSKYNIDYTEIYGTIDDYDGIVKETLKSLKGRP